MSEKILIFGYGQIANFYQKYFESVNISSKITRTDITKPKDVLSDMRSYKPTVVINTAAKTNLEWCSENKLETFNVNVLGADNIANACAKNNIYFIHFSSGCIFESEDEFDTKKESDMPNPSAYYAWTKVWAENLIEFDKPSNFRYIILRPRQPISSQFNYKNMLVKMLTFSKFVDTPNTGTVIEDLMEWTVKIIEDKPNGILHVANEGWATPYEIGLLLKKHILPSLEINKITKKELDEITPNRRVDTVLNVDKLKKLGIKPVPYKERLEQVIIDLAKNIRNTDQKVIKEQLEKTLKQSRSRTVVNEAWKDLLK